MSVSAPLLDDFDRLHESALLVVRHPDFPGKPQLVQLILEEIEERYRSGNLSAAQRASLREVLGQAD